MRFLYMLRRIILLCTVLIVISARSGMTQTVKDTDKKTNFIPLPIIGYDKSLGFKLGAYLTVLHSVSKNDTISPPSTSGAFGYYSTSDSWFTAGFQRLFIKNDDYRVVWALGTGKFNFQYYEDELIPGGGYIDYGTDRFLAVATIKRRVYSRLYLGLTLKLSDVSTQFELPELGVYPDSTKQLNGIGIPLNFDSRDNIFRPSTGYNIEWRYIHNTEWLGSDLEFSFLDLYFNGYHSLSEKSVFAWRATVYTGFGDVPFEALRVVGRTDIRGYTQGEYRGEQVYSAQTEYRSTLKGKWGYVGFFGVAVAVNPDEPEPSSGILPGLGAGLRYMLVEQKKVGIGLDVAVGKGDWGIYFRMGEAF
jgi:outer membrane protein assembly factor BamA